jgi:Plasmid pRiA4b ORF-3-like protein
MTPRRPRPRRPHRRPARRPFTVVHQFLVVLAQTDPLVWRRIQVPDGYSFWDLHVAIQDAMGWRDYHLHEFAVVHPDTERLQRIGMPDAEDMDERPLLTDWDVPIAEYFRDGGPPVRYAYDFGDDWQHVVAYEGVSPQEPFITYPRCIGGARACPPEDCGGVRGSAEFLNAVADPKHPEHDQLLRWAGGQFDPAAFDPENAVFDDPEERQKKAFEK